MLYIITKLVDIKNTKKFHDYNLKKFFTIKFTLFGSIIAVAGFQINSDIEYYMIK